MRLRSVMCSERLCNYSLQNAVSDIGRVVELHVEPNIVPRSALIRKLATTKRRAIVHIAYHVVAVAQGVCDRQVRVDFSLSAGPEHDASREAARTVGLQSSCAALAVGTATETW